MALSTNYTIIVEDDFDTTNVSTEEIVLILLSVILIFCCLAMSYLVLILHKRKKKLVETQLRTQGAIIELQQKIPNLEHPKLQDSDGNWSMDANVAASPSHNRSYLNGDDVQDDTADIIMTPTHTIEHFSIMENQMKTDDFYNSSINHASPRIEIVYDSVHSGDERNHSSQPTTTTRRGMCTFPTITMDAVDTNNLNISNHNEKRNDENTHECEDESNYNYNYNYNQMDTHTPGIQLQSHVGIHLDIIDESESESKESTTFPGMINVGTILRRMMLNIDARMTCIQCFKSLCTFCDAGYSSVGKSSNRMTLIYYENGKGLKIIIQAIKKHITDAQVAKNGMKLLNTLSESDMDSGCCMIEGNYIDASSNIDKLLEAGILNVIIQATELHCLDEDVVENGLTALERLSRHWFINADKRMIRDIYQRMQKYIAQKRYRSNIVSIACAILANIIILNSYETVKMVQHKKLIDVLKDVSIRFLKCDFDQQQCIGYWTNAILAHRYRNDDDYEHKTNVINKMEQYIIPAQITCIIDQFCKEWDEQGMVGIGNCLNLITLSCINMYSVDKNINIHLQLVRNNIGQLLKLMLEKYHTAYKNDTSASPIPFPDKQRFILSSLCYTLRNLVINSYIMEQLFGEDKQGIAFQLAKICQLHDKKRRMIGAKVGKNKYYKPKHSDIILCMNEPFTQDVLKALSYLRDCEWNHTIRYVWIGFHKNDQQCMISWLPKDLVRYIIRFLGNVQIRAACALYSSTVDEKFAIN